MFKAIIPSLLIAASVVAQTECKGCAAEAGAGLANPASPNNPDNNGDTDPANQANGSGIFSKTNIVEPGVAQQSWSLTISGNGSEFESASGTCKPNDADDDCVEDTSCKWWLKRGLVDTSLTITVTGENPGVNGTTNPSASANWTQDPQATSPTFSITFTNDGENPDEIVPGCDKETEYVITWKLAGADQRWEISFRCLPCTVKED